MSRMAAFDCGRYIDEKINRNPYKARKITCTLLALLCKSLIINGAGMGNRSLHRRFAID
jgi:hypothetical protein